MYYGVLLAAGTSSRMGRPKQLLQWRGRPLVRHSAEMALSSGLGGLVVVLGAVADEARAALAGLAPPPTIVRCPDFAEGQAASLRSGLAALPPTARGAVVLLVDMPLVGPALIDALIAAHAAAPEALAVVPCHAGRRGNPALLAARLFPELLALSGDTGARSVLARHADQVLWLDVDDPATLVDVDTPEAFVRLHDAPEG